MPLISENEPASRLCDGFVEGASERLLFVWSSSIGNALLLALNRQITTYVREPGVFQQRE